MGMVLAILVVALATDIKDGCDGDIKEVGNDISKDSVDGLAKTVATLW